MADGKKIDCAKDAEPEAGKIALRGNAFARKVDESWPHFKYMGFGFLYAWIWLSYNSDVLFVGSHTPMYLISTLGLAVALIEAALAQRRVARLVESFRASMVFGAIASVCTIVAVFTSDSGYGSVIFVVSSLLTGVGTAAVVLRSGVIYGCIPIRKAFSNVCMSFILAGVIYFVIVALPQFMGMLLTAALPLLSVSLTGTYQSRAQESCERDASEKVPAAELPKGFLARLVIAVIVFSIITGYVRGIDAGSFAEGFLSQSTTGMLVIFFSMMAAIVLYLVAGLLPRTVDISKLYSPIVVVTAFGVTVMPLVDVPWVSAGLIVGVAYNLFIMVIFCMLAHITYRTDLPAVGVFGFGRGASGLGTTLGWAAGSRVATVGLPEGTDSIVSIAMCFVLVLVALVLLKEGSIEQALLKLGDVAETDGGDVEEPEVAEKDASEKWLESCERLCAENKLSAREREVLLLLGRGRTIDDVANELTVSFNTAKTHVKHIYTKTGVHSRAELRKLIEDNMQRS